MPVKARQAGFNLIELIIGIAVLAIGLSLITTLLAPQARQTALPLEQLKASELGQSLANEILAKSFDENSDRSPPWLRCNESGAPSCTNSGSFGPDGGETRETYDDVDDYLALSGQPISDSQGNVLAAYQGYGLVLNVAYSNELGAPQGAKRISMVISTPSDAEYGFEFLKGNF